MFVAPWLLVGVASSPMPGARYGAATWYYNSTIWLYGGTGMDELSSGSGKLNDLWKYDPRTDVWTFVTGSTLKDQPAVLGIIGEASSSNTPGGLSDSCYWQLNNRLFLFGGERADSGLMNIVWRLDPAVGQWVYVKASSSLTGSYTSGDQIGARKSCKAAVVSASSTALIFGGYGYDSTQQGYLNDVWSISAALSWKFSSGQDTTNCTGSLTTYDQITTTEFPTCSVPLAAWTIGIDYGVVAGRSSAGLIAEVFRYQWSTPAEYTLLNATADLTPRTGSGTTYNETSAWIFGGLGQSIAGGEGLLSDLFRWDGARWQYVAGPQTADLVGNYPEMGTSFPEATPGARVGSAMWVDDTGDVWLFGGSGLGNSSKSGLLNDLWKFSSATREWTWIGGSGLVDQNGDYTLTPVAAPSTAPASAPLAATPTNSPQSGPTAPSAVPSSTDVRLPVTDGLIPAAQIAIGVVVPAVVIGVGLLVLLLLLKRRKKQKAKAGKTHGSASLPLDPTNFRNSQLEPNQDFAEARDKYLDFSGEITSNMPTSSASNSILAGSDNRLIPYSAVTLGKQIGIGAFGKVYLGKLRLTKVAIKVANAHIPQDEFIREANFQLAIPPHPNIVQLLGVSVDGPQPLVVLEYCNEGSLDKLLFEKRLFNAATEQLALAEAIARGIDHLHQNKLVHRDLAVRNILMHRGEPKISDFGMSRKLKEVSQVGKTAATIGPVLWMAPEAVGKQLYSTKSDVWSFGMILFEIVAHEEPHQHEDLISVAIRIRDEGFAPSIPENCPPLLREIMLMCWKMEPNDRPEMSTICAMLEGKSTAM